MAKKQPPKSSSSNLWKQLNKDLSNPTALDKGLGIWGEVRIKPGGLWKDARNETILLDRKSKGGTNVWQEASQESVLLPRSGRINVFQEVSEQFYASGIIKRSEKTDVWDELENETMILPRARKSLPKVRDPSKMKPIRITGWALKELKTSKGETYWVLKNLERDTYLRLNEQQVYFWEKMDGLHSLQDLAVAMFLKYKTLAIGGLMDFIDQLEENGLLVDAGIDIYQAAGAEISRRSVGYYLKKAVRAFLGSEFSLKKVDEFYTKLYRLVGKAIFWKPTIVLMTLICIAGLPAYIILTLRGELSLLGNETSFGWGLATLWLAQLFAIFLHESAHALTTKHYGRKVRRGGVGLYFGLPAFFMDTTDIWMEPRTPRIAVTWAGPMAGFILGGAASIGLLFSPVTSWAGFVYQFATFCIIGTVVNLNPLLKFDGYYILMDWLEIPMLREHSFRFIRQELRDKLKKKEKLSKEERIYTVYGIFASVFSVFAIYSAFLLYGDYLIQLFSWIKNLLFPG